MTREAFEEEMQIKKTSKIKEILREFNTEYVLCVGPSKTH